MSHSADGRTQESCKCIYCDRAPKAARVLKHKERAPVMKTLDGNADLWQAFFEKFKKEGSIDQDLRDPENMELVASRQALDDTYKEIRNSPSYRHRVGELVLFYEVNPDTRAPVTLDPKTQKPTFLLEWKAGVISRQNDEDREPLVEEDLFFEREKRWAITYSGFKVEFFPDPRASEPKKWSKRMTYVPLHRVRPFNYWEEVLACIPKEKWHPTINHAMAVLSSIAVLDCFHINGVWPNAATSCRSVWVGAELICIGDAVRLKPKEHHDQEITDVLVVDSMTALGENYDRPDFSYRVRLAGRAFTTNANHRSEIFNPTIVNEQTLYTTLPSSMLGRIWYHLPDSESNFVVSVDCVIGRLHGDVAMAAWFDKPGTFDVGLHGLLQGREYSRTCYGHTGEQHWRWAKTRVQQLGLTEINGVNISKGEEVMDSDALRGHMKVLNSHGTGSGNSDVESAESFPDSREQIRGASDSASARAVLGGRGFIPAQSLGGTQSAGGRSEENDLSDKEVEEIILDIANGRGLQDNEEGRLDDGSEKTSDPRSEDDELSTPNVKRLKINRH
ncbi:hypothetical protein GP486_003642 [Trichoglossum hirsutum]|uniref:Cryptic loci regulator 2 C-terminal domain-containing protein n=1 Tax=Trichoglossum hirsutum TaxID=265104 RepID=A0A9P8RQX2_9PEZI|nr:hypothetical protein GP486_003642 [Trichoglossum hirsutum]